jgi:hypothetical protein
MKQKIITNSKIPQRLSLFIDIYAITLYPYVFIKDEGNPTVINHEKIHLEQQRELWLIGFYFLYILYWLIGKVKGMSNTGAYHSIPFELEAYENDEDEDYLKNRKRFAWRSY